MNPRLFSPLGLCPLVVLLALLASTGLAGGTAAGDPAAQARPAVDRAHLLELFEEVLAPPSEPESSRLSTAPAGSAYGDATDAGYGAGITGAGRAAEASHAKPRPAGKAWASYDTDPAYAARYELSGLLNKTSDGWEVLAPVLRERFAAETATPALRGRMLQVLSWSPWQETPRQLAAELWSAFPTSFADDHLVAFAESGSQVFEDEVLARAKRPDAGLLPKAFATLAGDESARCELSRVLAESSLATDACTATLVAAAALGAAGEEEMFREVQSRVFAEVVTALDTGDLRRARELTLRAEYLYEAAGPAGKGAGGMKLSFLDERVRTHCAARSGELANADLIFTLIEEITPR